MAEINRSQRTRIADLMEKERYSGLSLSTAERQELSALQQLANISDSAPLRMVRAWADTGWDHTRSMTTRQRQVELLGMRWPRPRLSGKHAQLELLRIRGEWTLTPRQREVNCLRAKT